MTTLTVNLSAALQQELSPANPYQTGTMSAYAVYFITATSKGTYADGTAYDAGASIPVWTPLVLNGTAETSGGSATINLPFPVNGGKIYFLIQSNAPGSTDNLEKAITTESTINPANAYTHDFVFDSYEVSLLGQPGDASNLSSVNGFGIPMELSITYFNGTIATAGYNINGSAVLSDVSQIHSTAVTNFTVGPLAGQPRMAVSPSVAGSVNGVSNPFQAADWKGYVSSLEGKAASDIVIAGFFNGAADVANGAANTNPTYSNQYHNGGFFSYQLSYSAQSVPGQTNSDGSFWLTPTASSQIQGVIQIASSNLESSIYATLGSFNVYTSEADAMKGAAPIINGMNVGANNQWGTVFTQLLTGFTGGLYETKGKPVNPLLTTPVNLDQNWNWDPTYAFGNNLASSDPAVYSDPYSKVFYDNSNSYGSAYSDNLMRQYAVGGPLLSTSNPPPPRGPGGNVSNINVTLFTNNEAPQGYTPPEIYNYIPPGSSGYDLPVINNNGLNITLNLGNQKMVLQDHTPISLELYNGLVNNAPSWINVSIPSATLQSQTLWQIWNVTPGQDGSYSLTPVPNTSKPAGTMIINNLPLAANGVSWDQLLIGPSSDPQSPNYVAGTAAGTNPQTFNLYTTTLNGLFENPAFSGQAASLAVDSLALITVPISTAQTINSFVVNFLYSATTGINPSLLVQNTDPAFVKTVTGVNQKPDSPVVGVLTGATDPVTGLPTLVALGGQDNVGGINYANASLPESLNTVTTTNHPLAFGWTGTNDAADTSAWINHYTNKAQPLDVVEINFVSNGAGVQAPAPIFATANLDGQWTTGATQFAPGNYTVTMQEFLPTDATHSNAIGPTSSPLTLIVQAPSLLGGGNFLNANSDAYVILQGQALTTTATDGVLANDTTSSGSPLSGALAQLTQDATAGTLHLSGDGSLSYTPAAGFSGVDSFTYQASVGSAVGSAEAQIYVVPVAVGATSTTLNLFALTPDQQIAADYIAYLGRAPDADGFHFWEGVFNSVSASIDILAPGFGAQIGGIVTLSNIAKTISGSAEGQALNPLLTNPNGASDAQVVALLSSEYDILFNRSPDAQGLAYWTSQVKTMLANGQSINLLPVAMMLGAQGQDITTLMSKVAVALAFVNDQEQSGTQWAGASDVAAATALVHAVTSDPETVLVGISNAHALIETHP